MKEVTKKPKEQQKRTKDGEKERVVQYLKKAILTNAEASQESSLSNKNKILKNAEVTKVSKERDQLRQDLTNLKTEQSKEKERLEKLLWETYQKLVKANKEKNRLQGLLDQEQQKKEQARLVLRGGPCFSFLSNKRTVSKTKKL
ncbi:hypothetical protein C2G38_2201476 [Gigaspora rosea]|uniref:Uncharacterized protein n=1 Tax=Gigaspora rosea TaxID=44941 RepID=A0A397URB4_9GLOM|nr:hypothetical protein C2G38_2201476 [Gigaspora rosea]